MGAELVQQPGQVFCWRAGRGKAWIASCLAMTGWGMDRFVPRDVGELEIGQLA